MKKINIVKPNEDFNNIIKLGKQTRNGYYVIYYEESEDNNYRIGISVPKKTGNAVVRNKIKRQVKSILDNNINIIKKYNYIIIVRKNILELSYTNKEKELVNLINKI